MFNLDCLGNLMVYLDVNRGSDSSDIKFTESESFNAGNW